MGIFSYVKIFQRVVFYLAATVLLSSILCFEENFKKDDSTIIIADEGIRPINYINNNDSKTDQLKFLNNNENEIKNKIESDRVKNQQLSYKSPSYYTKQFTNSFKTDYNYYSNTCINSLDFLSDATMNSFKFNLMDNLKNFLNEYYTENLSDLKKNPNYVNYINKTFKKKTILIGIDGLARICADLEYYKSFTYLMTNGSYKFKARSTTEGVSGPGWSAILCSLYSEDTGIVDNKWRAPWASASYAKNYQYSTPITGLNSQLPCIFETLKNQKSGKFTNIFYSSWDFFYENFSNKAIPNSVDIYSECSISAFPSYYEYSTCDDFSLEASKNFVLQGFDFYFWYFSSLDVAGHNYAFCSSEYNKRLSEIDSMLVEFFDFLEQLNILDKINIIITTDHGTDKNHNSHGNDKYDGNLFVPIFMMGPDFKKNYEIKVPVSTIDIAPTIALINEMKASEYWTGKPIVSALNNFNENLLSKALFVEVPSDSSVTIQIKWMFVLFILFAVLL